MRKMIFLCLLLVVAFPLTGLARTSTEPSTRSASKSKAGHVAASKTRFKAFLTEFKSRNQENLENTTYLYVEFQARRLDDASVRIDISLAGPASQVNAVAASGAFAAEPATFTKTGGEGEFAFNAANGHLYNPSLVISAAPTDTAIELDLTVSANHEDPVRILAPIVDTNNLDGPSSFWNVRVFSSASKVQCVGSWWGFCCHGCAECGTSHCCSNSPTINCVNCTFTCNHCQSCSGIPASCGTCGGGGCEPNCK